MASHKERNVDCLKITEQEYSQMTNQASPNSKCWRNALFAFLIGGLICVIGQILVNLYQQTGLSLQDARCAVSVTLVGLSAVLTALHCRSGFGIRYYSLGDLRYYRVCVRAVLIMYG